MTRSLRIAMIGSRGVPATYGGVERHVEEVGSRLVDRGHEVTVYTRSEYTSEHGVGEYRGMRTMTLPSLRTKRLEALSHTAASVAHAVAKGYDIHHFHALGPGLFTSVPRTRREGSVLTVHGLDFQRDKWGPLESGLIRRAETAAVKGAHAVIVVAPDLVEYYRQSHGIEPRFIGNGVTRPPVDPRRPLGKHLLFVGRLTPEKGILDLVRAFRNVDDPELRLVVAGGASHTEGFVEVLRQEADLDPRVELKGYVFGTDLTKLFATARLFVQPSTLEGMPLTLLEAASFGIPLLASDIDVHRAMLGERAPGRRLFRAGSVDDLTAGLTAALDADTTVESHAAAAFAENVLDRYSWDEVAAETEDTYLRVLDRRQATVIPMPRRPRRWERSTWPERVVR